MATVTKRYLIIICAVMLMALVSCGPGREEYTKNEEKPLPDQEEHELELVSSVWGFGTANNVVMSADTGFFCLSKEDLSVFPTWYDPESMQKKSLGTEALLPYFEGYQVFTAGERLIACIEDNTRINLIHPPYEEVSVSHVLKDKEGKIWHIYYQSAIVFDRKNDVIYCSMSENDPVTEDAVMLASVDLNTGLVTPLMKSEPEDCLTLFACNPENILVLMGGRSQTLKQSGKAVTVLLDLKRSQAELQYSGEKLDISDKDEYCGYAFGDDGLYYISNGSLKKYSYADGTAIEMCQLSYNRSIPSQVLTDGKIHFAVASSDTPDMPNWYDTASGELLTFSFQSTDGSRFASPFKGFFGECGEWYCLTEYGPTSDISDSRYVLVDRQKYWTGTADVIRFE